MKARSILFVLLAITATQTARAAEDFVAISTYNSPPQAKGSVAPPGFQTLPVTSATAPGIDLASAVMESQSSFQGQAPPRHSARHTLRNILIIFLAGALMLIALAASDK